MSSILESIERPVNNAREAFVKLIAPDGNFEKGIYSNAYKKGKKSDLENFVTELKKENYDVYDWKKINQDLWSKKIDDDGYVPNASKSGILVTDGSRKILVKNYKSKNYNYPKGGINICEDPKDAALREFTEETAIDIDEPLIKKMDGECIDWKITLTLNETEYDDLIKKFDEPINPNTYTDLWSKIILKNGYIPNSFINGIFITDGHRTKLVKNNYSHKECKESKESKESKEDIERKEDIEKTAINIDESLPAKIDSKCINWKYTLKLSVDEYNALIKKFDPKKFFENATPEVSGIKLDSRSFKKKYLKYKNKYLELKKILNK